MKKSKMIYGVIVAVTLILAVTHQGDFLRFLAGFELLLAIFLFLQVRIQVKNLQVSLHPAPVYVKKEGDIAIETELNNGLWLPVPEIRVEVEYEDVFYKSRFVTTGTAMVDGKGQAVLTFHLHPAHCGVVSYGLHQVIVSDYLGLFYKKYPLKETGDISVSVIPDDDRKQEAESTRTGISSMDGDSYEQHRAGDDPSETYDIREFRRGDTIHRIHWKMSAKTDELLVRDFSQPLENSTLVLLDLRCEDGKITRDGWDHFLECAASFSRRLLQLGIGHYVAWYDSDRQILERHHVSKEEELHRMLALLVRSAVCQNGNIEKIYRENFADETISEIIRIDIQGNIHREEGKENRK